MEHFYRIFCRSEIVFKLCTINLIIAKNAQTLLKFVVGTFFDADKTSEMFDINAKTIAK